MPMIHMGEIIHTIRGAVEHGDSVAKELVEIHQDLCMASANKPKIEITFCFGGLFDVQYPILGKIRYFSITWQHRHHAQDEYSKYFHTQKVLFARASESERERERERERETT